MPFRPLTSETAVPHGPIAVDFPTLERRPSLRERVAELAVPVVVVAALSVVTAAISLGIVSQGEANALVPQLAACVVGTLIAMFLIWRGRSIEAPDHQRVPTLAGWFRFGPVGGIGGVIGIGGFVAIALLRAPMFAPVALTSVVVGCLGAIALRRFRNRQGPPVPPSIK